MSLEVGRKLAYYEILEPIGKGGMGEVYRARDGKLGRDVAIKVLPVEFSRNEERLARFQREARLLASLNHPGIATLYGLEESEGVHYFVMELVEGETLAARIAKAPIPLQEALRLFKQIAEALEAAHKKGIIHRDLKPANIMVTPEGRAKVLDFGLAKALVGESSSDERSESPTITRGGTETGVVLGTAAYMSPEQTRGKAMDKRTDIWSFGCVFYEALTGKVAFLGETVSDTIAAILDREPNWEALPQDTPPSIQRVLRRCFQKDRDERLRDVGDASIEIEEALSSPLTETAPFAKAGRHAWVTPFNVAVALVAIVAVGVALWSLARSSRDVPRLVTRTVIPLPPGEVLALDWGSPAVAISPNGQHIAYVAQRGDSTQLYLRAMDQLEGRPVDGGTGAKMPFFSPDGEWLGFHVGQELVKVSVTGGAPVSISEIGPWVRNASWGPDGAIVLSRYGAEGLLRVPAEGGALEVLTIPNRDQREKTHRLPEILPGGTAVLFTLGTGDIEFYDDASIAVLSLETGEYRVVLEGGTSARYIVSGHLVYARGGNLLAVPFDLAELRVTGAPVPVIEGVTMSPANAHADFSVSRDGSLLYAPGDAWGMDKRVVWVDRKGRSEPIEESPRPYWAPRFSPDGRFLAIGIDGANSNVWVYEFARSSMTRVTFGSELGNLLPIWTPDGDRVVVRSLPTENLFSYAVDGSSPPERLITSGHVQTPGSFSPDGKLLAFHEHHPETGDDIWLLSMEGDRVPQPFLQTKFNEVQPEVSPNGRWIAYRSDESGQNEIYVRPFPGAGAKRQVSTGGGTEPVWNPNGRELFYLRADSMMVVDIDTEGGIKLGKPAVLFERQFHKALQEFRSYDIAPDGQRFVIVEEGESDPAPTQLILVQNWAEELKRLVPTNN